MTDEPTTSDTTPTASDCEEILESWSEAMATLAPVPDRVREHLAACADCRRAVAEMERVWNGLGALAASAPSALLRRDFEGVLSGYREGMGSPRPADVPPPARAAEAQRTVAFRRRRTTQRRIYQLGYGLAALLAGIVVGVVVRPDPHRQEVAEMRGELRALRQDVALSMLQQTSASARLQGVSVGAEVARQDPQVLDALLETLATDSSPNVRLAAVDALAARAGEPAVQLRLGEALRREASPLVQIALADALLSADGEQARRIVAPLVSQAGVRQEVKQYVRQRLGKRT
jgi:hypothetical protein